MKDDKLLDVFAETLERSTEVNKMMLETLERIHKRNNIEHILVFALFVALATIIYLF